MSDRALPSDDSDHSLPGREQDSNVGFFKPEPEIEERPKSKGIIVAGIIFVVVAAGFFSYYFVNQERIDSEILDNTIVTMEERMVEKYNIGQFGSDHAHAAMVMFVQSERLNFGLPAFQLQSKYIHFENHNHYQIHKHANRVPLEMLFVSFGMQIDSGCITLGDAQFCQDRENSLRFFINGDEVGGISEYEIMHGDRILVFYGDGKLLDEQLAYLDSLEIHDIPKRDKLNQDKEIFI